MKKITFCSLVVLLTLSASTAFSQKYKRAEDTVNLNKEYLKVSNEIADLTAKLTIAQNKLPEYQEKASDAAADAQHASIESSEKSNKAATGDVKDARRAKRKAKQALNEAKDARKASGRANDQEKNVSRLSSQLEKKQARLQELEEMRTNINNNLTNTQ